METVEVNPKNVNEIRCFDPSIEDLRSKDEGLITESFVEQVNIAGNLVSRVHDWKINKEHMAAQPDHMFSLFTKMYDKYMLTVEASLVLTVTIA